MREKRERLIKRLMEVKERLETKNLILSYLEVELLDTLVWSIQEFLKKVSIETKEVN